MPEKPAVKLFSYGKDNTLFFGPTKIGFGPEKRVHRDVGFSKLGIVGKSTHGRLTIPERRVDIVRELSQLFF
jgi:hypothetical protein